MSDGGPPHALRIHSFILRRFSAGPICIRRNLERRGRGGQLKTCTPLNNHPPGRTDKNLCRCFGAPVRRVFPDHLIT